MYRGTFNNINTTQPYRDTSTFHRYRGSTTMETIISHSHCGRSAIQFNQCCGSSERSARTNTADRSLQLYPAHAPWAPSFVEDLADV
jgi:hypothetical protein